LQIQILYLGYAMTTSAIGLPEFIEANPMNNEVTLGLDLQPDKLTAGLAGHSQPDKEHPHSQK